MQNRLIVLHFLVNMCHIVSGKMLVFTFLENEMFEDDVF
jgi:hypothetical protein